MPGTAMPKKQVLVVMRHGLRQDEVDENWLAASERHWDPPLAEAGLAKVQAVAALLKSYDITKVVSSPFLRCLQTASIVCKTLHIPSIEVDNSICEVLGPIYFAQTGGPPSGQNVEEWMWGGRDPATEWKRGVKSADITITSAGTSFPKVPESLPASHVRYTEAIEAAADRAGDQNVLLVTHGEAVGKAVTRLLPWVTVYAVEHCGYSVAWRDIDEEGDYGLWQTSDGDKQQQHGISWRRR